MTSGRTKKDSEKEKNTKNGDCISIQPEKTADGVLTSFRVIPQQAEPLPVSVQKKTDMGAASENIFPIS
jgi:hypothetical protein